MPATPKTTILDDVPLVERIRAITIPAGQLTTIEWTMLNDAGLPQDITGPAPTVPEPHAPVQIALREAAMGNLSLGVISGTVVDAVTGKVSIPFDASKARPAIYEADIAVLDQDTGALRFVNRLYVNIETTLFGGGGQTGPPTRQQIRLYLRDSSAVENRLLDQVLFDDAEIAEAIVNPIRYWNGIPPLVGMMGTDEVPIEFRSQWINGIIAVLYRMAALWYHKNALTVSAGGITVGDMDKFAICNAIADQRMGEFQQWAKSQKVTINISQGYGHKLSPYGWYVRYTY